MARPETTFTANEAELQRFGDDDQGRRKKC